MVAAPKHQGADFGPSVLEKVASAPSVLSVPPVPKPTEMMAPAERLPSPTLPMVSSRATTSATAPAAAVPSTAQPTALSNGQMQGVFAEVLPSPLQSPNHVGLISGAFAATSWASSIGHSVRIGSSVAVLNQQLNAAAVSNPVVVLPPRPPTVPPVPPWFRTDALPSKAINAEARAEIQVSPELQLNSQSHSQAQAQTTTQSKATPQGHLQPSCPLAPSLPSTALALSLEEGRFLRGSRAKTAAPHASMGSMPVQAPAWVPPVAWAVPEATMQTPKQAAPWRAAEVEGARQAEEAARQREAEAVAAIFGEVARRGVTATPEREADREHEEEVPDSGHIAQDSQRRLAAYSALLLGSSGGPGVEQQVDAEEAPWRLRKRRRSCGAASSAMAQAPPQPVASGTPS